MESVVFLHTMLIPAFISLLRQINKSGQVSYPEFLNVFKAEVKEHKVSTQIRILPTQLELSRSWAELVMDALLDSASQTIRVVK